MARLHAVLAVTRILTRVGLRTLVHQQQFTEIELLCEHVWHHCIATPKIRNGHSRKSCSHSERACIHLEPRPGGVRVLYQYLGGYRYVIHRLQDDSIQMKKSDLARGTDD